MVSLGTYMWAGWDHQANEGSRKEKEGQAEPHTLEYQYPEEAEERGSF